MQLRCPSCGAELALSPRELSCTCGATVPFVRGVHRFVGQESYSGSFGYQWNRFARTQLDSANGTTRSRDTFVEKTGWALDELRGVRMLDAGCGMGRFAEVCASAGAEVHAVDLSSAVDACASNLADRPTVHVYQADILDLPFQPASFDRIYSLGVLHHTPDTRRAFASLVPLLRPGGRIAIWVYTTELRRSMAASERIRPLTTNLPQPLLLQLCRAAVPLYYVHELPVVGKVTRRLLPTSLDPQPDWRWLDTFDWYAPRYQWKHSHEEVEQWFRSAGLEDVRRGPFPVSVSGRRPGDRRMDGTAGDPERPPRSDSTARTTE